jgi:hypothetical protein
VPVSSFLGVVCYQFSHLPLDFSSVVVEIAHLEGVVLPSKSQTDTLQAQIERRYSEVLLFLTSVQGYCFWYALGTPPHVCIVLVLMSINRRILPHQPVSRQRRECAAIADAFADLARCVNAFDSLSHDSSRHFPNSFLRSLLHMELSKMSYAQNQPCYSLHINLDVRFGVLDVLFRITHLSSAGIQRILSSCLSYRFFIFCLLDREKSLGKPGTRADIGPYCGCHREASVALGMRLEEYGFE